MGGPTQHEMNVHSHMREQSRQAAVSRELSDDFYRRKREEEKRRRSGSIEYADDDGSTPKTENPIILIITLQAVGISFYILSRFYEQFSWLALGIGIILTIFITCLFLVRYLGKIIMIGFSAFYAYLSGNFANNALSFDTETIPILGLEVWGAWQIWIISIVIGAISYGLQLLSLIDFKSEMKSDEES